VPFDVVGPIDARWAEWNRSLGHFGPAVGPEVPVPGTNARRQAFQRGEIAWSADEDMVVSVFRLWSDALFEWSIPGGDHDYFRYDIAFRPAGEQVWQSQGQDATELKVEGQQQMWIRLQGFGDYAFTIRSCSGDDCGPFTVPVTVTLGLYDESPDPGQHRDVDPALNERWHELGAWDGPLGLPAEEPKPFLGGVSQAFEHGWITTAPQFGPAMVVAAYQRGTFAEVTWGGADTAYNAFRVDAYRGDFFFVDSKFLFYGLASDWARPGIGSGSVVFSDLLSTGREGQFFIFPAVADLLATEATPGLFPQVSVSTAEGGLVGATPSPTLEFSTPPPDTFLPYPPLDGSPAQAFASQRARVDAIARHYAAGRPLGFRLPQPDDGNPEMTEGVTLQLIAHLHAVSLDPGFRTPRELPSRLLVPIRLRARRAGTVGTRNDYDMALKGLVVLLYRYRALLADSDVAYIMQDLFPKAQTGVLDTDDWVAVTFPIPVPPVEDSAVVIPETENHLLMIESSKYLVNQLLFKQTGDEAYDNPRNNMLLFLMNFLQVIAKFDFMEFNARPYQRLSLHAIMNLYEFAEDQVLRTASAIILDYVMMKFAVSCSRERRISPFRRLQERIFYPGDEFNDLTVANGDQVGGFFHAWLGPVDQASVPTTTYWAGWEDNGVIAGLSTYRPPAAAYAAARTRHAPVQHVICHGKRGQYLSLADDEADGGVEIYYQSPSFVLNAGGSFLNSGYGHDAISLPSIHAWAQTSRAQAIALIPARLDVMFGDLIRLDHYPDPTGTPCPDSPIRGTAVNMGMHRGLACGANLRVPQLWLDYTGTTWSGPWLFLNLNEPKPGNAPLGFYVAVYATPMAPAADVDPVPDNLGLFYAMEADLTEFGGPAMAFEDFERMTRDRNADLPSLLSYGQTLIFHTPDDRHISIWLNQTSDKYTPRADDEGSQLPGFDARPLAVGPYLSSPRSDGHDGYIEIRQPDSDVPLILDFQDAFQPVRTDNAEAVPQPHIDRAQAIIAFSLEVIGLARAPFNPAHPIDPLDALRTAVDAFRDYQPPAQAGFSFFFYYGQACHVLANFLTATPRRDEEIAALHEGISALQTAAGAAGADPVAIAGELTPLAAMLSALGLTQEGAVAQLGVVNILRTLPAPPGRESDHQLALAESIHNLIVRLLQNDPTQPVADLAQQAITAYGACSLDQAQTVATDLVQLSKQLAGLDLGALAAEADQAAVTILSGASTASPEIELLLAESRQDLAARLVDGNSAAAAAALVPDIVSGYRSYAATTTPEKDLQRLRADLTGLADLGSQLLAAGLDDAAAEIRQALVELSTATGTT
jgi:hypothetical protein